jgi:hypothetical protein
LDFRFNISSSLPLSGSDPTQRPGPAGDCITITKPFEENQLVASIEKSITHWHRRN